MTDEELLVIERLIEERVKKDSTNEQFLAIQRNMEVQVEAMQRGFYEMDKRMALLELEFKHQREYFDKRFELLEKHIDRVDKRIDRVDKRLTQIFVLIGAIATVFGGLNVYLQFFK